MIEIKDAKDRLVFSTNEMGKCVFMRYPDMPQEDIEALVCEICVKHTTCDPDKVRAFLNYESDEVEFCS
jgi:hypothetical protein